MLLLKKYIRILNGLTERCQSGLMCTLGKRVYGNVSEVRILSSLPANKNPTSCMWGFCFDACLRGGFELGASNFSCVLPRGKKQSSGLFCGRLERSDSPMDHQKQTHSKECVFLLLFCWKRRTQGF